MHWTVERAADLFKLLGYARKTFYFLFSVIMLNLNTDPKKINITQQEKS